MYVLCDPMDTLEKSYWFNCSYVDSLKIFFNRTAAKEALVFRDIRCKGLLKDLQFVCRVDRRRLAKILNQAQG